MKNYNSIDLTKFILSIFVITIHCYIVPTIQQPLLRDICMMIQYTAVPLFFCFTGYFLFRRVLLAPEGAKKNIKRAWLRFGKLYLIWFIIYSVIIVSFIHISRWTRRGVYISVGAAYYKKKNKGVESREDFYRLYECCG